jgi:predicted XRE-type DNA-binding protein
MSSKNNVFTGSGNVFADLGLANSEDRLIKARLAHKISEIIASQNLTQVQAAEILGIDQPKISALSRGKLKDFSISRLIKYLNVLGSDVEITVKPKLDNYNSGTTTVLY